MPSPARAMGIAATASLNMFPHGLASDLVASLEAALAAGAVFGQATDPLAIFRGSVAKAITDLEDRAYLLLRFLGDGPYERDGELPPELAGLRLSDQDAVKAVTFIYSSVVNCFQGHLAELLAAGPCAGLVEELKASGRLPSRACLYVGDCLCLADGPRGAHRQAADMHVITRREGGSQEAALHGVVEVKSYALSLKRLRRQVARHIDRLRPGCRLLLSSCNPPNEELAVRPDRVFSVLVTPARWRLPRGFRFVDRDGSSWLETEEPIPPTTQPLAVPTEPGEWRIELRWSHEALASAAYDMTFWYMEKLGEEVFGQGMPSDWSHMTPAEAGRNAAKMMLYYLLNRDLGHRAEQRAIALYNSYCFGYSLGMNFRDPKGHRQMLWIEDLHEIIATGAAKYGCKIRG